MATIKQNKNGKYYFRFRYKDQRTQEWKEKYYSFIKQSEAKAKLTELEYQKQYGNLATNENVTVAEYFPMWINTYKRGTVEERTLCTIERIISKVIDHFGYTPIKDINRAGYQQFINKIAPNYAKSTLQRYNTIISEAFEDAIEDEYISRNPTRKVKYPKTCKPSKKASEKVIELNSVKKLFQATEDYWKDGHYEYYRYLTYFLFGVGCRAGEACATYDIDLKNSQQVHIHKTFVKDQSKGWYIKNTTKTGETGERIVSIDDFTWSKIEDWLSIRSKIIMKSGIRTNLLFIDRQANSINPNQYAANLKSLCKRYNLPNINPHMFRHLQNTIMWESGITDINYIAERQGNVDKSILLNIYGHKSVQSEQMNLEKVNHFMSNWTKELSN